MTKVFALLALTVAALCVGRYLDHHSQHAVGLVLYGAAGVAASFALDKFGALLSRRDP